MLSSLYRFLTNLGAPAIVFYLRRRLAKGREDPSRLTERLGVAGLHRPDGRLIWCHAASVGEAMSLLTLIDRLRELDSKTLILVTTGTVTSARLLAGRLPPWALHQYVPVDRLAYVKKFLDHWRPDLALWIESELWPNMLSELRHRLIPTALINGRMSEKSFRNWYRVRSWAEDILATFSVCLTQTEDAKSRFIALGAKSVHCVGNLKYAAKSLPVDERVLENLRHMLAGRAVWLMASTHRGEETLALTIHKKLKDKWPSLLTIIAPRHAVRGNEVAADIQQQGLIMSRRSQDQAITPQTDIYLADTMGELGLLYRLSPLCALGGSFTPVGGHNPIEPAQLSCAIIFGPHMFNFSAIAQEFILQKAAIPLQHENELFYALDRLLATPDERARYGLTARLLADQKQNVLVQIIDKLRPMLNAIGMRVA
jgi:3-deoxy-D-manno-octulosonic-acid transferase